MIKFYICNSFTDMPFTGNPAGVVFDDNRALTTEMMQLIAAQLNLVETTFVLPPSSSDAVCDMRYFTPLKELPITGHPTLAAWSVMLECGRAVSNTAATINTAGGPINITYNKGTTFLSQSPPEFCDITPSDRAEILSLFSLKQEDLLEYPMAGVNTGLGHLIFGVKSLACLLNIKNNIDRLKFLCQKYALQEAQIFTMETHDPAHDVHTRNFCPRLGLEDPACGNGNAALGAYALKYISGPDEAEVYLRAEQGHIVNKPSLIHILAKQSPTGDITTKIGGNAIIMAEGLFSPAIVQ